MFTKTSRPASVVFSVSRSYFSTLSVGSCFDRRNTLVESFLSRSYPVIMAQKSITSFFKITPKKEAENKDEKCAKEDLSPTSSPASQNEVTPEASPVSKKNPKRMSKRQRMESSSSGGGECSSSPEPAPPPPEKRKSKRQRIESSDSELSSPPFEDHDPQVKVEPTSAPRTYASPKTKLYNKSSHESVDTTPQGKRSKKKEKTIKKDESPTRTGTVKKEKSPKREKSPKLEKEKSPKLEKEKSPKLEKEKSPKAAKVKSPLSEKNGSPPKKEAPEKTSKNVMNFFIMKESKEHTKTPQGKVPEEEYNPSKSPYHPIDDACWATGQDVPYLALAKTFHKIEGTTGRLKTIEILSNYLRSVAALSVRDLVPSVYLCLNQLAPAYHSLELGIAETYLMKAISFSTGSTLTQVRASARKLGDLGEVAQAARAKQTTMVAPRPNTVSKVFESLKEIARMTGQSSVQAKITNIQKLYIACRSCEAKYLFRSLEGKLRIGLAEQSVLQALALAVTLTPPTADGVTSLDASKGITHEQFKAKVDEQALIIKSTYCECPNYELIIPALIEYGVRALPSHCKLTPGVPLKPMLAHPTKGVSEVFDRFENEQFTCEWKYDGERTQIHVPQDPVTDGPAMGAAGAFSRSQENHTSKYPDVLSRLPKLLKPTVHSCVLDAEAVAYDVITKQILPFQILSTRKRKDATESAVTVQVCVFVFDLLYLNGQALVKRPLMERRQLLKQHFNEVHGEWQFAVSRDCTSTEEVQQFLEEAIKGSCEGLMVKTLTGPRAYYDIARRSHNWLKLKKDYLDGCGDSIDAVVVGAYLGRGKRAGRYGGFLLACADPDNDEYQSLCKIGTGFTDEDLATLTDTLQEHVMDTPPAYYRYDESHRPDVWLSARCVWEVRCADLSLSPTHWAAKGLASATRGVSLRFPRFIRVRDDKRPEQATSAQQIADMYRAQDQVKNTANTNTTGKGGKDAEDDFY